MSAAGSRTDDPTEPGAARITVIIPCFNDGAYVEEAVCSVEEAEAVEIVVVDDGSDDEETIDAITRLEADPSLTVIRHEVNKGVSASRMTALAASAGAYVFPLDADDLALPGSLAALAEALELAPGLAACFGDYAEFGERTVVRAVPRRLDPFRIVYTNEYPATAMFRRSALRRLGGWRLDGTYEDWDLWMAIAERGEAAMHLGEKVLTHMHRIHTGRLGASFRHNQARSYGILRAHHPELFAQTAANRRVTDLSRSRQVLYPLVYGSRPRLPVEKRVKAALDRSGVWTMTRSAGPARYTTLTSSRLSIRELEGGSLCHRPAPVERNEPRVAVIIPCFNDGAFIAETVASIDEREPVEVIVVDDASSDEGTAGALARLEAEGCTVLRHSENRGVSASRMTAIAATSAPFVMPLDADDIAMPQMIELMADRLEASAAAAVCYGDYAEFGARELVRAVPEVIDPFRVAYVNEYPPAALFRRSVLVQLGGWRRLLDEIDARSDWALWMTLAEAGVASEYVGANHLTYARRMHPSRLSGAGRRYHYPLYRAMQARHRKLFEELPQHRQASQMSPRRKPLYPVVYGGRRRYRFEPAFKQMLDRLGIWTLRR